MQRRRFLSTSLSFAAAPAFAAAQRLEKTPGDFEGPFYPVGGRHRTNDLIVGPPQGDVLELAGLVQHPDGTPRARALVDIWQADPEGRYKHPRDREGPRRSEFLYWGEAIADTQGRFSFRTYVPGEYGERPAEHIHFKVWAERQELLTSQLYFAQLGGHGGYARSKGAAHLQILELIKHGARDYRAQVRIVV